MQKQKLNKIIKEPIISFSNTIIKKRTMMVMHHNTIITIITMSCSSRSKQTTNIAILINIRLRDINL
jgi:hypothetical protein